MAEERSTVRSRQLGDALRSAMDRANLSGKRTAALLGWSESRVSRILTGKLGATEVEVASLLTLYGVIGDERDSLLQLTREQNVLGWLQNERSRTLTDHQRKAARISDFHIATVPGLLQTEDYARAVLGRKVNVQENGLENMLAERKARQDVFSSRRPPACLFFLHELALQLPVGGTTVMVEQLHHLLRMGVRANITIRVVPTSAGAHAGLAGSCSLLEFVEFGPVVYVEEEIAGHFMEDEFEVFAYRKIFASLGAIALDEKQTKAMLGRLAVERYGAP